MKIALRVVDDLDQALEHIDRSHRALRGDVTEDAAAAYRFTRDVDAAAVYVNASTRFSTYARVCHGAEIGNLHQPLHSRGPLGLEELTTTSTVVIATVRSTADAPQPLAGNRSVLTHNNARCGNHTGWVRSPRSATLSATREPGVW